MNNFKLILLASVLASPAPANAHIVCDGEFQVLRTGQLSTPFCQDEDLARKARSEGVRVTGETVRRNPSIKANLCAGSSDLPACFDYIND